MSRGLLPCQTIWVFEQNNSAAGKIAGIKRYAKDTITLNVFSIDDALPPIIDDASAWLPKKIEASLVLDHFKHPDLTHALAQLCKQAGVPVIASGKKGPRQEEALLPRTCCALRQKEKLGNYGKQFGRPEFTVNTEKNRISAINVRRGAPCGATWQAAEKIIGLPVEQAAIRLGLETQYFCVADPSNWDPISGKSPVHIAGELHKAALMEALKIEKKQK
ncbi:MAG: hypothetical protein GY874_23375 [Desulfobacteraceae bacterium]|nr:hypothetical protein [Desulfobacteraceae bacterium]